ncbi:unnamed protein product, partial [marine sediment metagenome]
GRIMPSESQGASNVDIAIHGEGATRRGQRLTISNREVSKLSFFIARLGSVDPGGVRFRIRKVSDDSILASKALTAGLTTSFAWVEVTFDTPVTINEEVRILVEKTTGNSSNCVRIRFQDSDVKAGEVWTAYSEPPYSDNAYRDMAYIYTYEIVPPPVTAPTITAQPATSIEVTTARSNGEVTDNGGENPTVHIYWGTSDGQTTPGNWDHDENLGVKAFVTYQGYCPCTSFSDRSIYLIQGLITGAEIATKLS